MQDELSISPFIKTKHCISCIRFLTCFCVTSLDRNSKMKILSWFAHLPSWCPKPLKFCLEHTQKKDNLTSVSTVFVHIRKQTVCMDKKLRPCWLTIPFSTSRDLRLIQLPVSWNRGFELFGLSMHPISEGECWTPSMYLDIKNVQKRQSPVVRESKWLIMLISVV